MGRIERTFLSVGVIDISVAKRGPAVLIPADPDGDHLRHLAKQLVQLCLVHRRIQIPHVQRWVPNHVRAQLGPTPHQSLRTPSTCRRPRPRRRRHCCLATTTTTKQTKNIYKFLTIQKFLEIFFFFSRVCDQIY